MLLMIDALHLTDYGTESWLQVLSTLQLLWPTWWAWMWLSAQVYHDPSLRYNYSSYIYLTATKIFLGLTFRRCNLSVKGAWILALTIRLWFLYFLSAKAAHINKTRKYRRQWSSQNYVISSRAQSPFAASEIYIYIYIFKVTPDALR